MHTRTVSKGFSIVELMIVVVIVAILVAMALPSYQRYVRKANRTEAQQLMMQYANNQEIWRANNASYATAAQLPKPTHAKYTFHTRATGNTCGDQNPTAVAYTVVACASGDQLNDKEGSSTTCSPLTLTQANQKAPAACW